MSLVRAAARGVRYTRAAAPVPRADISAESWADRIYRWADVTGHLTRYNNRKFWIQDMDPLERTRSMMLTEAERKVELATTWLPFAFLPVTGYYWLSLYEHSLEAPPVADPRGYHNTGKVQNDFTLYLDFTFARRCTECSFLDFNCKKACYDRYREDGVYVWGLHKPLDPESLHHAPAGAGGLAAHH